MITISCDSCSFNIDDEESIITVDSIARLHAICRYNGEENKYEDIVILHYCSKDCLILDLQQRRHNLPQRDENHTECRCMDCRDLDLLPAGTIVIAEEHEDI